MTLRDRFIRRIHLYRQAHAHDPRKHCRFDPSCSTYALQVLESRPLPLALLAITGRIVRCNPLVRIGTKDPVHRTRRRLRPNALRTALIALFLGGLIVVFTTGLAFGQSISGGCSGTVNRRDPRTLTFDNPLVVGKGENVTIAGTAPTAGGQTVANYRLELIEGVTRVKAGAEIHGEGANWTGTVNVDRYLTLGSGKYHVTGNVTTTKGSYNCPVSFYVFLDGNKILGIVGAGIAGAGGLGVWGSSRGKPPTEYAGEAPPPPSDLASPTQEATPDYEKDTGANTAANAGGAGGCMLGVLLADEMGIPTSPFAVPFAALAPGSSQRVWSKGKTGLGVFSGLFVGIGGAVALQQFGYTTLSPGTLFVLPALTALFGGLRAWRGTAYKIVVEEEPPPPPDI